MGGGEATRNNNPLIPDTGAAKYWYVDPSTNGSAPTSLSTPSADPTIDLEALKRIGLLSVEESQSIGF